MKSSVFAFLAATSFLGAVELSGLMKPGDVMDFPGYRIRWTNQAGTRQISVVDEVVTWSFGLEKDSPRFREEWGFDPRGLLTSKKIWRGDGTFEGGVTNTADAAGFVNESTAWQGLDRVHHRWAYQRTNGGLITEETRYGESGKIDARNTYLYDSQGRETNVLMYHANGLLEFRRTQAYDSAGNRSEMVLYRSTGTIQDRITNTYTNGLPLTESVYDIEGALVRRVVYTHTNTAQGARLAQQRVYRGLGDLREQTTFSYDPSGRLFTARVIDGAGLFRTLSSNTYDASGRKTEETIYQTAKEPAYRLAITYDTRGRGTELSRFEFRQRFGGESWELSQRIKLNYVDGARP